MHIIFGDVIYCEAAFAPSPNNQVLWDDSAGEVANGEFKFNTDNKDFLRCFYVVFAISDIG